MEREEVASKIEMTLIDDLHHQECSEYDSVDEIIADLLVRDSTISHYKISIVSCNKIFD